MTSFRLPARLALAAFALLAALVGSSCAKKGGLVIGLSLDTLKEERWQHDKEFFEAEVKRLGADVVTLAANSDDTQQVRDIQSLISKGVNVLVVVAHNGKALSTAVQAANDAKIPVLAYDRLISDVNIDYYMSFDNVKVGELQGAYVAAHLPAGHKAKVVRIYGAKTDNNAVLFKQGQDNILNPLIAAGKIEVVHEDWATNWDPAEAKKIMNSAITKVGRDNIDIVLASNDGTAGGAIQALSEEKLDGKVLVTGQDAELAACQRIMAGTQAMTIYKPLKTMATTAAQIAVEVGQGKTHATTDTIDNGLKKVPAVLISAVVADKDNMMATVVADGFHTAAELK